jgi:flagellar biogenesis protein FliO
MNGEIARQALAVVFVLVLAVVAAWRLGGRKLIWPVRRAKTSSLQILERVHLTPQHTLHRLKTPSGEMLLVTHAQGVQVIAETNPKGAAAS